MPSCSLGASPNLGQAQAAPIYLFVLAFPRRAMSEARQAGRQAGRQRRFICVGLSASGDEDERGQAGG